VWEGGCEGVGEGKWEKDKEPTVPDQCPRMLEGMSICYNQQHYKCLGRVRVWVRVRVRVRGVWVWV
jgi:hypothetical protein